MLQAFYFMAPHWIFTNLCWCLVFIFTDLLELRKIKLTSEFNRVLFLMSVLHLQFQWLPKCGSHTSSINITWKLIRNANSWIPPQVYLIKNSEMKLSSRCFNKPSRWLWYTLTTENYIVILIIHVYDKFLR